MRAATTSSTLRAASATRATCGSTTCSPGWTAPARGSVAGYSTGTRIVAVNQRVTDVSAIRDLGRGADIVVCAIDSPQDIQLIVNEACFVLGVPLVTGGLSFSTLSYWSVEPGRTPCRLCLELHRTDELATLAPALRRDPFLAPGAVNRATGPVAQLASGLVAMETMRYLTRTDPPVAAAVYQVIELADGMTPARVAWRRHTECRLCARTKRAGEAPVPFETATATCSAARTRTTSWPSRTSVAAWCSGSRRAMTRRRARNWPPGTPASPWTSRDSWP